MWETPAGKQVQPIKIGGLHGLAFSPSGARLATVNYGGSVGLWNVATGKSGGELRGGHSDSCTCVAFSPDGSLLVSGGLGPIVKNRVHDQLRMWDAATGRGAGTLPGFTGVPYRLAFSPDGTVLAGAGTEFDKKAKSVRLWTMPRGSMLGTLDVAAGGVSGVAFSPDGVLLASASADKTARLWDVATGKELHVLKGHDDTVNDVAFSPSEPLLASSGGGTVRLWR